MAEQADGDARVALNTLETAARLAANGNDHPRHRPGGGAEEAAPLRQGGGGALQRHLRLHQVDARQRPGRGPLLAGPDDRGGGGPDLHPAPHGDPRLRGHRQRRPAGAPGGSRGTAGVPAGRAARGTDHPGPGGHLPRHRPEIQRLLRRYRRGPGRGEKERRPAGAAPHPERSRPGS